jgi:hypothetical protein
MGDVISLGRGGSRGNANRRALGPSIRSPSF